MCLLAFKISVLITSRRKLVGRICEFWKGSAHWYSSGAWLPDCARSRWTPSFSLCEVHLSATFCDTVSRAAAQKYTYSIFYGRISNQIYANLSKALSIPSSLRLASMSHLLYLEDRLSSDTSRSCALDRPDLCCST